tara:strand:- start:101 stop:742 length:642 start_codon:yes stop_codon:yes gene_type:complete
MKKSDKTINNWEKAKFVLNKLEFNYATLSKEHFKWFEQECKKAKNKKILANSKLIGHIKEEYVMDFPPDDIINMILSLIDKRFDKYLENFKMLTRDVPIVLSNLWCNFQKKYEFNPPHDHSGVFSFVVFIKIPYSFKKEMKCFNMGNKNNYTSKFTFHTINRFGKLEFLELDVDKSFEGKIIFFPATQMHQVFPFYTSDDYRITVSGNMSLKV